VGAVVVLLVVWVLCAFVGLAIGSNKGRATEGFLLGLVLGVQVRVGGGT
jgi:hypothetical protein